MAGLLLGWVGWLAGWLVRRLVGWFGLVWFGLGFFYLVWFGLVFWFGFLVWFGLVFVSSNITILIGTLSVDSKPVTFPVKQIMCY